MAKIGTKNIVGGLVTGAAGIAIPVVAIMNLFTNYFDILKGFLESGRPPGLVMQAFHQPLFAAIMMLAGVLLLVSSVGYFYRYKWAFIVGLTGSIITIFGGWMLAMFPLMVGLAPFMFIAFFIGAIVFFVLLLYVNKVETKLWVMSLLFGMAFVMTFMNGNASLNKMIGTNLKAKNMAATAGVPHPAAPHPAWGKLNANDGIIYELVQQFLWVGAFAFFVVAIAVVFRKDWVWPVALGASIIAIGGGLPVAYLDSQFTGETSQFYYGPVLGIVIFLLLFLFKDKLWAEGKPLFKKKAK